MTKHKLENEALEQVTGGWKYNYNIPEWLDGTDIKCPRCGCAKEKDVVPWELVSRNAIDFLCWKCEKGFRYRYVDGEIYIDTYLPLYG